MSEGKFRKWTKSSAAAKKLQKMVTDGTIGADIKPKTVYDNYPELFEKYSLKQFSNALDRIRSEDGALLKPKISKKGRLIVFFYLL
jgi:hypothetical protein